MTWSSGAVNYLAMRGVVLVMVRFRSSEHGSDQVLVALSTVK